MSFLNSVIKVFVGDKSKQDVKALMPLVEQVKSFEAQTQSLSNDELRARTLDFKNIIAEARKEAEDKIVSLQEEADSIEDIDRKEDIYLEIDALKDDSYNITQDILNEILPEAFAVVKETTRRFVDNTTISVKATAYDRELSAPNPTLH